MAEKLSQAAVEPAVQLRMMYEYGMEMLEEGAINSLSEWSDEKERACSIMDRKFDYLWDFSEGIHFIDRLYASGIHDVELDNKEAELWFDSFNDVFHWIEEHTKEAK